MKKLLLPLLLALLLTLLLPAACAEDAYAAAESAVYTIVLRTDEGDIPLGSGVLFAAADVLLTADACAQEGELVAIGAGGECEVVLSYPLGNSGVAILQLALESTAAPLGLADYSVQALPYIFGVTGDGTAVDMPLYQAIYTSYRGYDALLLSAEDGLLPGGAVVDENGALVAIVVAQNGEGRGMYTALPPATIYDLVTAEQGNDAFLDVQCTWQEGLLTVSWENQGHTDGLYVMTISGTENSYYTTYTADPDVTSISLAAAPGHTYDFQVQWAPSEEEAIDPSWPDMTQYTVPEGRFIAFGFEQDCYLASTTQDVDDIVTILPEAAFVTADMLTDGDVNWVLQIINRYDVDEDVETTLSVELIAPDGQFYFQELGYLFSPDFEEDDVFCVDLAEQLADCAAFTQGGIQPGEYTLRYAIGGLTAGEYSFTVHEAGTPAPAEPSQGFVTDLTITCENGCATLDWSEASDLPQGDVTITAFAQYEGNTYYTYQEMKPDVTETFFFTLPDRWCAVWVVWTKDGETPVIYPDEADEFFLLDAAGVKPFTTNGFTNVSCSLTTAEAVEGEYLPEAGTITRDMLTAGVSLSFQTEDTYNADAATVEHPLVIALYTPEGYVFLYEGYYSFAPELSGGDIWAQSLTDSIADYVSMASGEVWPAGEYAVRYYIDGCLAGETGFTLP